MNFLEKRNVERQLSGEPRPTYGRLPYVDRMGYQGAGDEDLAELMKYLGVLRQHWLAILVFGFLGLVAAVVFSLTQTPVYRARTSVEILGSGQESVGQRAQETTRPDDLQTHESLLKSQSLISRVLKKLQPERMAANSSAIPAETKLASKAEDTVSPWAMIVALVTPAKPVSPQEKALGMAMRSLKVNAARQGRLIEISSDSTDPVLAARFVNTLTNQYIEQRLEQRWSTYQKTGDWLNLAHEDLKRKLEKSEEKLQEYARSSGLLYLSSENTSVAEQKLKQLQEELSRAQADRITKQSRHELSVSSSPESLPEVLDNGPLVGYQVRLADLRRQLAELSPSLTPAHPRVVRIQAQITEVEGTLTKERGNVIKRVRNEYQSGLEREKLLASNFASQAGIVGQQSEKAVQYNILKREVETNRHLYEATLQKGKEASIDSALRASDIRVVDPARTPGFPYKPNLLTNLGFGTMLGFALGVGLFFLNEFRNRRIRVPGETPILLNVPELGVIPASTSSGTLTKKLQRMLPTGDGLTTEKERLSLRPGANGTKPSIELTTWQNKSSALAESFRTTLASIVLSGQNGKQCQVITVTSAFPTEGKTTISSNLAIALAEIGHRVVLVDADMRRPRQHKIFNLPNSWGLSDLLREKNPIDDYPNETLTRRANIPNLNVLTSGPGTDSIANLLYSDRLSQLLNRLRREFDTILIDSPPMLQISDARVVGRSADGAILVIRSGKTSQGAALAAVQRFQEDGTHVLGTILNDWNPKATQSSDYEYDYTGYCRNSG